MQAVVVWMGAALLAGAPITEQRYRIKFMDCPAEGKSVVKRETEKNNNHTRVIDADGKEVADHKTEESSETEFTSKVLKKDDKGLVKEERTYKKANRTSGQNTEKRSYEGRTLYFEKRDGKIHVSVKGDPALKAEDLRTLTDKANDRAGKEFARYADPKKAVRVGESWSIPSKAFSDMKDMTIDTTKSKGTAKLVKAYRKDGRTWGVIKMDFTVVFTKASVITFEQPGTMEVTATIDAVIDGTSPAGKMTGSMKMVGKGNLDQGGVKITIDLSATASFSQEVSAEK